MTEQEAREKWCPMGRVLYEDNVIGGTYNRMEGNGEGSSLSLCLASDCAMWVWDRKGKIVRLENGEIEYWKSWPEEEWQGHCGLIRGNK